MAATYRFFVDYAKFVESFRLLQVSGEKLRMSKGKRIKLVLLVTGILSIIAVLTAKLTPKFVKQAGKEGKQERLVVNNAAQLQSSNREIANKKVGSELLQTRFNNINLELAKSNSNKFIIVEHRGESYLIYDSEGDAKLNRANFLTKSYFSASVPLFEILLTVYLKKSH